jgi:hypothetical protein
MEIRVTHALEPSEVLQRVTRVAAQHDIELEELDERSGRLSKNVMLVGAVRARFTIAADHLHVDVTEYPQMLEGTLRRLLEDELAQALG